MSTEHYLLAAVTLAAAITFALRLLPFIFRRALKGSQLLDALSHWLPLGAMICLTAYVLLEIDYSSPQTALPYLAGAAVTAGLHLWRKNMVLSLAAGSAVCIILANWVF